jgi:3D (Asp-Asp-Asp) domain-containing protein
LAQSPAKASLQAGAQSSAFRYGPALVPGRIRSRAGQLAGLATLTALVAASAAIAAPGGRAAAPAHSAGSRVQQALLELYALDSRLHTAHARVSYLEAQAVELRQQGKALRAELGAAKSSLRISQNELALHLRALYEQGNVDSLAVVLGASSLGKGLRRLDDLRSVADESQQVVVTTKAARMRLLHARRTFAADTRRLARSLADARGAERSLSGSVAARTSYVASLRAQVRAPQVKTIVSVAHAAVKKSQPLQPPRLPVKPPLAGGRRLTVSATCYILRGTTASGLPVGPGIVAVDPTLIPLGTKLYIPGYGKGVAADVGGGIKGAIIDLWYSTYAQCAQWGRRTVTITVY